MSRITEELLKKRAEHNECRLTNLEEISLHQQELLKIENLDILCRHIRILYLQNNIIDKMENLNKLKELDYLNLALNNISVIENISGCESLRKLDLTVNFVELTALKISCDNLAKNHALRELYLTGNPCTDWEHCRTYVIGKVQQLMMLDGVIIPPSEKISAKQKVEDLEVELFVAIEMAQIEKLKKKEARKKLPEDDQTEEYSRENRHQMYMDLSNQKLEEDKRKNPKKYEEKKLSSQYNPKGELRQCNEGGYKWSLNEHDDAEWSQFTAEISKFVDTSLIDVEIYPTMVSIRIKGKLLQIRLNDEVIVEQSSTQRSQATGQLMVKLKKLNVDSLMKKLIDKKKEAQNEKEQEEKIKRFKSISDSAEQEKKPAVIKKTYDKTTFDDIPDLE